MRVFHDSDADLSTLDSEKVAVLGYGIQGRAQALTLRDSGVSVVVGNRRDAARHRAEEDGFSVRDLDQAAREASLVLMLLPDEVQAAVFEASVAPHLSAGDGVVFAHGFVLRYQLVRPPQYVDVMLLAPRMPGQYLRRRYLEGWGVPAFVSVEHDATGGAWARLLALSRALGITRCGALPVSADVETELDHFSQHFIYPLFFRTLELAFEALVEAGYPPEAALMELHGSGEIGQVLETASRSGLYEMIESHASPACQVGIAHHWERVLEPEEEIQRRIGEILGAIRQGTFAQHLLREEKRGYPELRRWRRRRSVTLVRTEARLRRLLRGYAEP